MSDIELAPREEVVICELCGADLEANINEDATLSLGSLTVKQALNRLEMVAGSLVGLRYSANGYLSREAQADNDEVIKEAQTLHRSVDKLQMAYSVVAMRREGKGLNQISLLPGVYPWQREKLLGGIGLADSYEDPSCLQIILRLMKMVGLVVTIVHYDNREGEQIIGLRVTDPLQQTSLSHA